MEKAKLLRLLIVMFLSLSVFAEESDYIWAKKLAEDSLAITLENFKVKMEEEGFDANLKTSISSPKAVLQIFVSSSMPVQLLKSYVKQAYSYNGILVFRGLPQGSFKKSQS